MNATPTVRILVDADACPVKDEIYKVAWRLNVPVSIVSNSRLRVPDHPLIARIVVSDGFDAADDWIAETADAAAVVITADILLADRCLKAGAAVLAPNGKPFTHSSIGSAIATRAIMADLRAGGDSIGTQIGGPPPFSKTDRSRFLSALDEAVVGSERYGPYDLLMSPNPGWGLSGRRPIGVRPLDLPRSARSPRTLADGIGRE